MIAREYLEKRLRELIDARDKHQADLTANNGAIQFCQHLLTEIAAEAEPEGEPVMDDKTAEALKPNGVDVTPS